MQLNLLKIKFKAELGLRSEQEVVIEDQEIKEVDELKAQKRGEEVFMNIRKVFVTFKSM